MGLKGVGPQVADSSDCAQNFAGLQCAEGVLPGWKPLPLGCGQEGQSLPDAVPGHWKWCLSMSVPALAPHQRG